MRKFLLTLAALLIAGAASAQPIGVRVTKDTTNSRLLVRADNGEWLGVWGSGTPSFTTFLGENVPAGAIYFNTATGTPYKFSSGSWSISSGGTAGAVTPGTTTVGSCTNGIPYADGSSVLQCGTSLKYTDSGTGNFVISMRKSFSAETNGPFNIDGTMPVGVPTHAVFVRGTPTDGTSLPRLFETVLAAGYTGSNATVLFWGAHQTAGTDTAITNGGNAGVDLQTTATTVGTNIGLRGIAQGGNFNIGVVGRSGGAKAAAPNVGVYGIGLNTTSNIQAGGYFTLATANPTIAVTDSAGIIVDNAAVANKIANFRDNGTTVVQIRDGGSIGGKDAINGTDSDTAGGNLVIGTGLGTGTGAGGDLKLQRSPSIATGTTIQTASDAYYIRSQMKALTAATATPFARINLAQGVAGITGWTGGTVFYTLVANDAAEYQSRSGTINFTLVNKGGTETCAVGTVTNEPVANSSGTTTLTFDTDTTGPTNGCDLRATGASSLSETTLALFYSVVLNGPGTVTPQ